MRSLLPNSPRIDDPNGTHELTIRELLAGVRKGVITEDEFVDTWLRLLGSVMNEAAKVCAENR